MNNSQVAAGVKTLLMVGGGVAATAFHIDQGSIAGILGVLSALIGAFWHHYSVAQVVS